jgi:RloB-like protein
MAKINRKKLIDRQYNQRDARLCVIAVEGAVDEAQYFKSFGSRRLKVEILKTESDNKSAPKYVFQRLDEFSAKHDLDDQDMLWLVMDVDRWGAEQLSRLSREATQKDIN